MSGLGVVMLSIVAATWIVCLLNAREVYKQRRDREQRSRKRAEQGRTRFTS